MRVDRLLRVLLHGRVPACVPLAAMFAPAGMLCLAAMVFSACGGRQETQPTSTASRTPEASEPPARSNRQDEVEVSGLLGTLSDYEIEQAMQGRLAAFSRCMATGWRHHKFLSGRVDMVFRVDLRGNVKWVYPAHSSLGDRVTERCVLEAAAATSFPRPRGGEVEFRFPLAFAPREGTRVPEDLPADALGDLSAMPLESLWETCNIEASAPAVAFGLTLYVGKGGKVLAAGVETSDVVAEELLDCLSEQVRGWTVLDPGRGTYKARLEWSALAEAFAWMQ